MLTFLEEKKEGSKRLESFVSEYYFRQELYRYFEASWLAMDWFYTNLGEKYLFIKNLYTRSSRVLTRADRSFIQKLLALGHRVVLVHFAEDKEFRAVEVSSVSDRLAVIAEKKSYMPAIELFQSMSGKLLKKYVSTRKEQVYKIDIGGFLDALGSDATELYLSRVFIYEVFYPAFHRQPSDIDAIVVKGEKHTCIEFKRKGPAKGYFVPHQLPKNLDVLKNRISRECGQRRSEIEKYLRLQRFKYSPRGCYGLDAWPHSRFVRYCAEMGVNYYQINWDRPDEESVDKVDWSTWKLKELETFYGCYLHPDKFCGFTFTIGGESGMFSYLRFQETVNQDCYTRFELQSDMQGVLAMIHSKTSTSSTSL